MKSSLKSVPVELIVNVFRKMNPRSFCRLRRTCKFMEAIADEYRFKIKSRSDTMPLVLCVSIDGSDVPNIQFNVFYGNADFNSPSDKRVLGICKYLYPHKPDEVMKGEIIADPTSQLSGIRFDFIMMYLREDDRYHDERKVPISQLQAAVWREDLFPFMANLNLSCEWLYLWKFPFIEDLAQIVEFQRFSSQGLKLPFSTYLDSAIWHCSEIDLDYVYGITNRLSPIVKSLKTVKLYHDVDSISRGNFNGTTAVIYTEFLEEVIADRRNRGNLAIFQFLDCGTPRMDLPFLDKVELWRDHRPGRAVANDLVFERFPIDGGTALMIRAGAHYVINFLSESYPSRETLLSFYEPYMFPYMPFDVSAIFEDFDLAVTDQEAFSITGAVDLYRSYFTAHSEARARRLRP